MTSEISLSEYFSKRIAKIEGVTPQEVTIEYIHRRRDERYASSAECRSDMELRKRVDTLFDSL